MDYYFCIDSIWIMNNMMFVLIIPSGIYNTTRHQYISICVYIDGLVQDCSNSIALAMELLQSCAKPFIWCTG